MSNTQTPHTPLQDSALNSVRTSVAGSNSRRVLRISCLASNLSYSLILLSQYKAGVKAVYRRKAMKWNPDRNPAPEAERLFQEH